MTLIGIYGDSRSGKDSVAKVLVEELEFEQRNLADPIRQILMELNPIIDYDEYGAERLVTNVLDKGWNAVKETHYESVELMIRLGQSCRDIISPTVWLDACLAKPYTRLVIPDVRQCNEFDEIIARGGVVWKVQRAGTVPRGMDRLLEDKEFDVVLYNNHTLKELKDSVLKCGRWAIHVAEADQKDTDRYQD